MIKLAHPIIEDDERRAVLEALESGQLAQGPRVAAFEAAFAAYVGAKHAVAVNSGTAALHLARCSRTASAPGDEVIVPAFSFAATANTVLHAGARPVFVDVREDDFGIDVGAARSGDHAAHARRRSPCTCTARCATSMPSRAICGRRGIALIEDAAQAVGASMRRQRTPARSGTGCFSFYATKNLQTGEGGMITTDDDAIAERARACCGRRASATRYVTEELGYNYRMTEIAAALGHAQLPKLDARNERRRANAARLTELLVRQRRASSRRASCPAGGTSGTSTPSACAAAASARPRCRRPCASAASKAPSSTRRRSTASPCTSASATATLDARRRAPRRRGAVAPRAPRALSDADIDSDR